MHIKVKKVKHRTKKNLGAEGETAYRLNGRWGKARTYGHNCEQSNNRTRQEMQQRADEIDTAVDENDYLSAQEEPDET